MKILLDCRLMTARPTGISRYSEKLLSYYVEKYGYENITALVNEFHPDIKCQQHKTNLKPFNILHWLKFPLWLRNLKFDYYISFHYSGLAYKVKGIKSAITVHDMMFELVPGFFSGRVKKLIGKIYFRFIVKRSMGCSNAVLSVSETTRKDVKSLYGYDSVVTGEGLFLNAAPNSDIISQLKLNDKSYYLYIGNNRPHKNIGSLLKAFEIIHQQHPERSLVLVGHRSDVMAEGVIYPGFVSDEQLVSLYQHARVFVFPSLYEGFGLPILEALSNNCAVIASDIPAFREFENDNIIYFDLKHPTSLLDKMSAEVIFNSSEASVILDRFSWANTYRNLDLFLERFI